MILHPIDLPFFTNPDPPRRFGELEAALGLRLDGPIGMGGMGSFMAPSDPAQLSTPLSPCVDRISVKYGWDMYHESIVGSLDDLRDRRLETFSVSFSSGWDRCEPLLRSRHGQPASATEILETSKGRYETTFLVFGPLFLRPLPGSTAFIVDWYARSPDWAAPAISPEARARWLGALPRSLRRAHAQSEVHAAATAAPSDAGIAVRSERDARDVTLELVPAARAVDVADALGLHPGGVQSVDVHQSHHVIVVGGLRGDATATSLPLFGAWTVEATLLDGPYGPRVETAFPMPISRRELDSRDTVRYLRIAPRR